MPSIFDNIATPLLPVLQSTLRDSYRADFCVGYFNLRGWQHLDTHIDGWIGGEGDCVRLLVGMQARPEEELREMMGFTTHGEEISNAVAHRRRKKMAEEFHRQLTIGTPTNADEAALRRLAVQIRDKKLVVKLFTRHHLHAKLYLLFRKNVNYPTTGFLGSSNLTFAGLKKQGELNIDVLDPEPCNKLSTWFNERWNDKFCIDISEDLIKVIEESWAREDLIPPYHIYVKMAYHLSQDARAGLSKYDMPVEFRGKLFSFQEAAVKIAAHHLNKQGGVLIGDVVGLGKTIMATALARMIEDDLQVRTLIICPKNLKSMWEDYCHEYRLHAKVLPLTQFQTEAQNLRRYGLVVIDESHNLRNAEGKRYKAIREYIKEFGSRVILLSATPYNKTYLDLSSQLGLFVPLEKDLGIRPEKRLREIGESEFIRRHQCGVRTLAAFEKSEHVDDWRELMRHFLVRRTRTFIKKHYAIEDPDSSKRYLEFADKTRSYFPERIANTVEFNGGNQYDDLYSDDIVAIIDSLSLPRYGLGNYIHTSPAVAANENEVARLDGLSRAGRRLMGFCRTNLFKRLESSGQSFLVSLERHVLRNYIFLYAIESGLNLPQGTLDAEFLDARYNDEDADGLETVDEVFEGDAGELEGTPATSMPRTEADFRALARVIFERYSGQLQRRFRWIRADLFSPDLAKDLKTDAQAILGIIQRAGAWKPSEDGKLGRLVTLLATEHAGHKVLVFSQFADTVRYLEQQLKGAGLAGVAGVTGSSEDVTGRAWRFSPVSNNKRNQISPEDEYRILIATDVLSEGQNLQDCAVVVNYDLPWAIIRLIQRAGRVDRIGQTSDTIRCYTFWPTDGVNRVIALRERLRTRLRENADVVGADERFGFEDDHNNDAIVDLYHEKSGILEDDDDAEVDLASYAYQIWNNAVEDNPALKTTIPNMRPVVYSTKKFIPYPERPEGVLVYTKTTEGNDALAWVNTKGESVTESQFEILRAAECSPETPAMVRHERHHELVRTAMDHIVRVEKSIGGELGSASGARYKVYTRLKDHVVAQRDTLFDTPVLREAIESILRHPLRQGATDRLNRELRARVSDARLAEIVVALYDDGDLTDNSNEIYEQEAQIICSMGLFGKTE